MIAKILMGCIPFCCCMKFIGPKKFAFTAIICNVFKIGILIASYFLVRFSVKEPVLFLTIYLFELALALVNIIVLCFITIFLINGKIYDKFNKRGKNLCIITIFFSVLIFISIIAANILARIFYGKKGKKGPSIIDWLKFNIACAILNLLEIIHFFVLIYLFKLIKLHSNVSYNDYKKSGLFIREVSIHTSNSDIKNPQIFPYNNPSAESSK